MQNTHKKIHAAIALFLAIWCGIQAASLFSGAQYFGAADAIYEGIAHMKLSDIICGALATANAALFAISLFRVKMMRAALILLAVWMAGQAAARLIISGLAPGIACWGRILAAVALLILYRKGDADAHG